METGAFGFRPRANAPGAKSDYLSVTPSMQFQHATFCLLFSGLSALCVGGAACAPCEDVVPAIHLEGDFEIIVDPDDPAQNLLLVANTPSATGQDVVIARLDGATGALLPDGLETIATNFEGSGAINGPEFAMQPSSSPSSLGVLFAGNGGVRAAWRSPGAVDEARWRDFTVDVFGNSFSADQPPLLPSTEPNTYPAGSPPFHVSSYPSFNGACTEGCLAYFGYGSATNISQLAQSLQVEVFGAAPHPVQSGGFFLSARNKGSSKCGLYSGQIDGSGGLVAGSFLKLASISSSRGNENLIAQVHPATGTILLFRSNGAKIELWHQSSPGAPLTFLSSVSHRSSKFGHFRADASTDQLVLNYTQASGAAKGTYTLVVNANLSPSRVKRLTTQSHGVELLYLPRAGQWATFTRSGSNFRRCWVVP